MPATRRCGKSTRSTFSARVAKQFLGPAKGDGKLTFDKLTDVYYSGTRHEDDQPTHLVIADTNICNDAVH